MPSETPLAKNCTLATVPSGSAAVTVKVLAEPTPTVPAAGAAMTAVGDWFAATVTLIAVLVV